VRVTTPRAGAVQQRPQAGVPLPELRLRDRARFPRGRVIVSKAGLPLEQIITEIWRAPKERMRDRFDAFVALVVALLAIVFIALPYHLWDTVRMWWWTRPARPLRAWVWWAVRWIVLPPLLLLVLWFVLVVRAAKAHDGYEWIMNEPRYVDRVGIHCCSTDCRPVPASEVTEHGGGVTWNGQTLKWSERGIYRSAAPTDAPQRFWVCVRGKLTCIFRPMPDT
jgi:hypothetical protein